MASNVVEEDGKFDPRKTRTRALDWIGRERWKVLERDSEAST